MRALNKASEAINVDGILKSLADSTRLRLLSLLMRSGESLCVCEIVDALKVPQYRVSRHLNVLRRAGVVEAGKRGTWVYYRFNDGEPFLRELHALLSRHLAGVDYERDEAALSLRLGLRANGRCVVGFLPDAELKQMLRSTKLSALRVPGPAARSSGKPMVPAASQPGRLRSGEGTTRSRLTR